MNLFATAATSFAIASAATLAVRWWPHSVRTGWLELDGRPVAVDGIPVATWQQANEALARLAAHTCRELKLAAERGERTVSGTPEPSCREFRLDYVPSDRGPGIERLRVRQEVSGYVLWAAHHPVAFATYTVVAGPHGARR